MMRFSSSLIRRDLRSGSHDHPLNGFFQFRLADGFLVAAGRQDGAFVDQVFQVCAHKTGGAARNTSQVHAGFEGFTACMHFQDGLAPAHIGPVEGDAAVETTGAQQGWVEDVGTVGGSHYDYIGVGVETIHLDQHLVEGLFALIVRAAQAGAALASDSINFIYENNTGRVALGLVEQVTHAAGAHADEHFHKLRAGDREEGHARLRRRQPWQAGFYLYREGRPAKRPWGCAHPVG